MSFKLGLTGSIGMGKTTTARMFADEGCAVWDADAAVHRMYAAGGSAVAPIAKLFPGAILDGAVSRSALKKIILSDPVSLSRIEKIVHPLVAEDRAAFSARSDAKITVFDIPLLFERGIDAMMDAVVCVSIPPELQQRRIMERGTMTLEEFQHIHRQQISNDEKLARSDYVVLTDTLEHARAQVQNIVRNITKGLQDA